LDQANKPAAETFLPNLEAYEKIYRGQPVFEGAPASAGIPWEVGQAQPRLRELEALGAVSGDVLDIGCGLGDNAIYLASRGHRVTGLDGSPTAIEGARVRAAEAGVSVRFEVADATELAGYDAAFDTVIDSALYHCLDEDGQLAYATALHRAARPGARWFLYCFSAGNVNGVVATMPGITQENLRSTLGRARWRIDFIGPTTYLGNISGFTGSFGKLPPELLAQMPPERAEQLRRMGERMATIIPLIDGDKVHLPFTVVHATRLD
jgi:SAM-dependent methyltransferase